MIDTDNFLHMVLGTQTAINAKSVQIDRGRVHKWLMQKPIVGQENDSRRSENLPL